MQQVGAGAVAPQAAGAAQVGGSALAIPIMNQAPPDLGGGWEGGGWGGGGGGGGY